MQDEVNAGLEFFRRVLRPGDNLKLEDARRLSDRLAYHLVFVSDQKQTDIVLTHRYLTDLPNTPEYQAAVYTYVDSLKKRMENLSPSDFYCKSDVPLGIEIHRPMQSVPMRAASYVFVEVYDLRGSQWVARCSVNITDQQYMFDLERDPFRRDVAIINTIREAVDQKALSFYPSSAHPPQTQQIRLVIKRKPMATISTLEQFVGGKVYWLAFRRGDKRTKTWIADPWDGEYLGVETKALTQTAQLLEAHKMIELDSTQEFATAAEGLLQRAARFEALPPRPLEVSSENAEDQQATQRWDIFICHASEDKDNFVRPLATALQKKGLSIWYDDFTLKVGDSLRQSIDRGLSQSRYGVVVLSPAFFGKHWPERELDGLVAKEVGGKKVILPVWHNVTADDVRNYSLTLADRVAASSSEGLKAVVEKLIEAMRG
ncbi:MAG: toll/interleukin-1 receptor domain-containing protein [Candidatus Acidiferrales bacterium]